MFLHRLETRSQEALTPEGLCNLIQFEFQPEINTSCSKIESYLLSNPQIKELPVSVAELVQLVFSKLEDEIKHLFLKQSGIVYPCIKRNYKGTVKMDSAGPCLEHKVFENIHNTHQVIINLMQRLRQLLNNFSPTPNASMEWRECLNELFTLETKVLQWIHVEQNLLYPKVTGKPAKAHHGHHHH
ncbi:MAG: hypothetical protein K2Y12_02360 [Chitinophagaceae bacterium]|jgi:iron-sulfur cluster repair protein YtfE (RIC family)|nr:hypothetical protein [Chitinophagaceae bacterium]HCT22498.1 hypothetical protein [Chitinophagaceae bacterium]